MTTSRQPSTAGGFSALWPFNILFGPALLAVAIVVATVLTDSSYASYLTSRLTPVVSLSNGAELTLQTTIDDAAADLRQASYSLHVPRGVGVRSIVYDGHGSIESVGVTSDLPPRVYRVSVTVTTGAPAIAMTISLRIRGVTCLASPVSQAGVTGRAVTVVLRCS